MVRSKLEPNPSDSHLMWVQEDIHIILQPLYEEIKRLCSTWSDNRKSLLASHFSLLWRMVGAAFLQWGFGEAEQARALGEWVTENVARIGEGRALAYADAVKILTVCTVVNAVSHTQPDQYLSLHTANA